MAISDQKRAQILLDIRSGGYTASLILRYNWRRYALLIAIIALVLAIMVALQQAAGFYVVLGMLLGTLFRDLGWFRAIRKGWPFTERVTTWDEVQRIANGETVM